MHTWEKISFKKKKQIVSLKCQNTAVLLSYVSIVGYRYISGMFKTCSNSFSQGLRK